MNYPPKKRDSRDDVPKPYFRNRNGENIKKKQNMYREICLSNNRMIGHKFRMMTNTISV